MWLVIKLLQAILRELRKIVLLLERLVAQFIRRPARLVIEGGIMDIITGSTFTFAVTCFDGETPPVAVDDSNGPITMTATPADTSVTVSSTSSPAGVYSGTGVAGPTLGPLTLIATDGILTSSPFTDFNIVANPALAPASLVITSP